MAPGWHRPDTDRRRAGPAPPTVLARTLDKAWGDSLFGLSSQAAFWSALSTPPLLLALLGMVGYIAHWFGPGTMTDIHAQITVFLHTIFNPDVADLVGNTVDTILNNGQADVVSIGLIISLWAGSSAMSAFIESITIAYGQHEFRHPVVERLFALGLYLVALASGILLVPLLAIGPDTLPRLFPVALRPTATSIVGYAYYPVLVIGLLLLLTTLYKLAPQHKHAWKRGLPGALLAAVFFLIASAGLRLTPRSRTSQSVNGLLIVDLDRGALPCVLRGIGRAALGRRREEVVAGEQVRGLSSRSSALPAEPSLGRFRWPGLFLSSPAKRSCW